MSIACPSPTEVATRASCLRQHNWPTIDVTRRSIEETAAAIIDLHRAHQYAIHHAA